jgi:hypothetical protein
MKKNLLLLIFFCLNAHAEEVKLNCNISLEHRFSAGPNRRENVTASVDVYYSQSLQSIKVYTHKILANVNSIPLPTSINFQDRSNAVQWNLMDDDYDPSDKSRQVTRIFIDRNTGVISYSSRYEDPEGFLVTQGNGSCVKVDPSSRRF